MPPAIIAAGVVAGGALAGGIMGSNAKKAAQAKADSIAQQASDTYTDLDIPTIQSQQVQLQQIANAGNLTPDQEATFQQNQSLLNAYQQNPEAVTAQMQALKQLQKIGSEGGLTAADRAQMNQIQNQLGNQEKSARNALVQNYAQRGMAGSGVQLAAELSGNQGETQAAADQGFNVAAQAQQRALQAIQGAGQLGTGLESQQFGQAATMAGQQNAINQFNTANAQNIAGQNVQRANYAQERNLNNQQQINAQNTGLGNQEEVYNKGLYQQQYNNQLQKASGQANALGKQANMAQSSGNAAADLYSGIGNAVSKGGTAVGNYFAGAPSSAAASGNTGNAVDTDSNAYDPNKYKLTQ